MNCEFQVLDGRRVTCLRESSPFGEHPHIGVCDQCEAHYLRTGQYPTAVARPSLAGCENRWERSYARPCGCKTVKFFCTYGTNAPNGVPVTLETCRHCQATPGWIESVAG
jgi:hypothetical protein